ncbi:hypothetical protein NX794_33110 [Streptomyces sp. LP11]|uniref:DUF4259 domain-containing protein n=1 Tax=Streptomyces pyxinicus TaxID=2970331 RepID=A0ABT2BBW0_9ACTN|nr:hypothetical protein [Streptomyces sp. LP11]MCS0606012.1 hypothetical protein [Streptomyces sp. LP11]
MDSWGRAAPGVERHAELAVETACQLADIARPDGWSAAAAEDVLDAVDTLTEALSGADPELAQALAAVAAATGSARRRLGITVDESKPSAVPSVPAARRPPKRRGLGPGFQGIRAGT